MGFSTIIILMLINGYAVAEMTGRYDQRGWRLAGAVVAGLMGFAWVWIWPGQSRTWLIMAASAFAAILLPIAYLAFFLMMNNPRLLGDDLPRGRRRWVWNILMAIGVAGAFAQAIAATLSHVAKPVTGSFVLGGVATFLLLVVVGFSARSRTRPESMKLITSAPSRRPSVASSGNVLEHKGPNVTGQCDSHQPARDNPGPCS